MSRDRDRRDARVNPGIPVPAATAKAEPGPAAERWAYAPGVTPADIAAAQEWCRANESSSPIHLVAAWVMVDRVYSELDGSGRRAKFQEALAAAREIAARSP